MIEFFEQETLETCGASIARNILYNIYNIKEGEKNLVDIIKYYNPSRDIKRKGIGVNDIANLGRLFGLKTFSRKHGNINEIKTLIDDDMWPIIHRPLGFNEDYDGHYVLSYFYNHSIYVFDPYSEGGGIKTETYEEFNNKWNYPKDSKNPETWFMFFYKNNIKIPFKGKYL